MRFINHSCEPNCGFEKWNVRGQERCGVFSIRHIRGGDELTVEYGFKFIRSTVRLDHVSVAFVGKCWSNVACARG
jgi:SET domain-containing protein